LAGALSRTPLGKLTALRKNPSCLRGPTSKGLREGEEREWDGVREGREMKGRERKGREWGEGMGRKESERGKLQTPCQFLAIRP